MIHCNRINKKGMSYAELLTVVIILAIVLAIAMPSVVTIQKQLNQTELDAKAETIYVAVQNKLSKMKAGGNTGIYQYQDVGAVNGVKQLLEIPGDADEDIDNVEKGDICYITSSALAADGSAAAMIVDAGLMDDSLRYNHWVIEYNPKSAIVYAVYYSEEKVNCSEAYEEDFQRYDLYLRYRANRLADGAKVGYYGGGSAGANSAVTTMTPVLSVQNAEKLIATVTCVLPSSIADYPVFKIEMEDIHNRKYTEYYAYWESSPEYRSEIAKEAGAHEVNYDANAMQRSGRTFTLDLILDDLSEKTTRFVNLYGTGSTHNLVGGPLKITVTAMAPGNYKLTQNLSDTVVTNSLFADKNSGDDTQLNTAYGTVTHPAVVNYARHLQNLDISSGLGKNVAYAEQNSDVIFAEQAKDNLHDWAETYTTQYFNGLTADGKANFKPIDNNSLQQYDGRNHRIASLSVYSADAKDAGLFAQLKNGQKVQNVTMTGAKVISDGGAAGSLVGTINGTATISNCQTFLTLTDIRGKNNTYIWIDGKNAGGLIGAVQNGTVTITDSAASTVVGALATDNSYLAESAGGLIGFVGNGNVNITRAYADSYLSGKTAGGLIGASSGNVRLTDIYTAGFVSFDTKGAGLVCGAADMAKCYTVLHKHGLPQTDLPYYAVAQSGTAEKVYYDANSVGASELTNTQAIGSMTIVDMAQVLGASFSTDTTDSMAYNLMGQSLSTYVYPVLSGLTHYGDWAAAFQTGAFVYYEAYSNGTYGFYGANVDSTLNNNADVYVVGDGYGVVYQANDAALPDKAIVKIKDGNTEIATETVAVSSAVPYEVTDANGVQYQIYPLSKETINTAAVSANYYLKAELLPTGAGKTEYYYFNPHFAKTVLYLTDGNAEAPALTKDSHIAVRTARHLYMMSLYYDKYAETTAKATFLQERNIDYAQYDWNSYSVRSDNATQQQPIAGGSTAFCAVYDGGYHWITDVSFTTVEGLYVGFIGRNEGTVRNVVLRASYTEGASNNYYVGRSGNVDHNEVVYIGVLVGSNEANGRIENCAAGGYYLSGSDGTLHAYQNSNLYAGGLVGSNAGTIINSAADTPKIRLSASYADVSMGGFVGINSGIIRNSYALGHLETIFAKGGHVAMAGFAGENIAIIGDSYCATALTASGETAVTYGFAPAGGVVNNCRYLNNGTYSYIGQMYSFNFDNGVGTGIKYRELQLSPDAPNAAKHSYDFNNTVTHTDQYPFPAVVRNASNELVHYGDWLDEEQMGKLGIFYWEHEVDGINNGYRFTYLGMHDGEHTGGTSLCNAHDDGGKIESYGYGYYELEEGTVSLIIDGAEKSDQFNKTASEELKKQLHLTLDNGEEAEYTFYAYTVRTPAEAGGGDYLYLSEDKANSTWTLTYKPDGGNTETKYTYTVSPFFANAMSTKDAVTIKALDGTVKDYSAEPGTEKNPYEVRSVQQLQYINWNHNAKTDDNLVDKNNYQTFTYLHYDKNAYKNGAVNVKTVNTETDVVGEPRYWIQTHDANGEGFSGYTPIAGNSQSTSAESYVVALHAWFGGNFDGQSYKIQNLNISSNSFAVGLFGVTAGANMKNIILYSDNNASIVREYTEQVGAYTLGGLIGVAYDYNVTGTNNFIENCAIAGYKIIDRSTNQHGLGEANIGGLIGVANVHLKRCAAVTDILLDTRHSLGGAAKWGVFIRIGGLTGAAQGLIQQCYSGGSVKITEQTIAETVTYASGYDKKFEIYVGGIAGSGFTSNYANFTNQTGVMDGSPTVENCYTYLEFPSKENTNIVKQFDNKEKIGEERNLVMFLVASVSDRVGQSGVHKATINNCYYLNTIKTESVGAVYNGSNTNKTSGTPILVTYAQMTDMSTQNGLLYKLTKGYPTNSGTNRLPYGAGFSNVTITEGSSNVRIDGKHSYPGSVAELEGKNYPFLAVIQQRDLAFGTAENPLYVYVHYGEWPLDGPYWKTGRDSLDIFQEMQQTGEYQGYAVKTFYLNPNGKSLDNLSAASFTVNESLAEIAKVEVVNGEYAVTVKAKNVGVATIALKDIPTVSFDLEITADIQLSAEPNPMPLVNNAKDNVVFHARSYIDATHDAALVYDTGANVMWNVTADNMDLVELKEINANNIRQVTRYGEGEVVLTAVFTYDYHGVPLKAVCYVDVLQPLIVTFADVDKQGTSYNESWTTGEYALPTEETLTGKGITLPTGYKLVGWKVAGDDTLYAPGSEYHFTTDITFTAQWEQYDSITLHVDKDTAYTLQSDDISIVGNLNALDGYPAVENTNGTFQGWYTKEAGTYTKVANADGKVISAMQNGIKLYAGWTDTYYTKASALENGKAYLILSGDSGTVYALKNVKTYNYYYIDKQSVNFTVENRIDNLTSEVLNSCLWIYETNNSNCTFKNNNAYLYRNNYSLAVYESYSTKWICSLTNTGDSIRDADSNNRYIAYSNNAFTIANKASTVYFFHEVTETIYADQIDG